MAAQMYGGVKEWLDGNWNSIPQGSISRPTESTTRLVTAAASFNKWRNHTLSNKRLRTIMLFYKKHHLSLVKRFYQCTNFTITSARDGSLLTDTCQVQTLNEKG